MKKHLLTAIDEKQLKNTFNSKRSDFSSNATMGGDNGEEILLKGRYEVVKKKPRMHG